MSKKTIQEKNGRDEAEWSSEEEYQGSERGWGSDNDWNEDSSLAGEASGMSEGTDEERPGDGEDKTLKNMKTKKKQSIKPMKLDLDDVGTEDDGESRHPEDITERTDGRYSKTNGSDVSDMSDIEDQIAEAQHRFMEDKQSLTGMMGLVDEVTTKGENLTKKASETSLVVERDTLKKGAVSNDRFSLFDDDEISFRSYTDRTDMEDDQIPQRDLGKMAPGRIEYMNENDTMPKRAFGLGHIEYLDENKSNDSGSLISEQVDLDKSTNKNDDACKQESEDDEKSEISDSSIKTEAENLPQDGGSESESSKPSVKSSDSSETFISRISNQPELECKDEDADETNLGEQENEEGLPSSPEYKEFEEIECSKYGEKHLCCYLNLGAGGDDGRGNELVSRLKKLKDDIANMRKELTLARQECKKESEEVAKLIEAASARNKAAEQNEIASPHVPSAIHPAYSSPNYTQEIVPVALLPQTAILPGRAQVAIPTTLLEERLRATRHSASSNYRESLNELERMVEKEMASIKDSMTRLEPLNKIAAEWDAALPMRDPMRTTYKSDYKLEMVTSEMRLQAPDTKSVAQQV